MKRYIMKTDKSLDESTLEIKGDSSAIKKEEK